MVMFVLKKIKTGLVIKSVEKNSILQKQKKIKQNNFICS